MCIHPDLKLYGSSKAALLLAKRTVTEDPIFVSHDPVLFLTKAADIGPIHHWPSNVVELHQEGIYMYTWNIWVSASVKMQHRLHD